MHFEDWQNHLLNDDIADKTIDQAWLCLLGPTKKETIQLLLHLKKQYKIYLLSNTNPIHVQGYTEYLKTNFGLNGWKEIFHQVFYSHELGTRKPSPEIFQKVLNLAGIKANDTLFLDDAEENIQVAKELGFQVIHINNISILDIFTYGKDKIDLPQ